MTNNEKNALKQLVGVAQTTETLNNYREVDRPLMMAKAAEPAPAPREGYLELNGSDERFWRSTFSLYEKGQLDGAEVYLDDVVLSEWVPRAPGLFWRKGAERLRKLAKENHESRSQNFITFQPRGKSQMVTGGVGTVRLPPSENGFRLVSLTASHNASSGVPLLLEADDWERLRPEEGCYVRGNAKVILLPIEWHRSFPALKGLPRLCLRASLDQDLSVERSRAPIRAHPFSVMKYWDGDATLVDYVYMSGDSTSANFRKSIEKFFERYRKDKERDGVYLISGDVGEPMWDAIYASPADMRSALPSELDLIERRAMDRAVGDDAITALLRKLSSSAQQDDLKRISEHVDINWRRWYRGRSVSEEATNLVAHAAAQEVLPALAQAAEMELS